MIKGKGISLPINGFDVINEIKKGGNIYLSRYNASRITMTTNLLIFEDGLIFTSDDEKIVLKRPPFDYRGKMNREFYTSTLNKVTNRFTFMITSYIDFKELEFEEEESNQDLITIYYK